MSTTEALLTAEAFCRLPDLGYSAELVRGQIEMMNVPSVWHGIVCNRIGRVLGNFVDEHNLGWVVNNDSGVITERDPDTVRGADVAFYSYARLPRDTHPEGYATVPPEIVFEVASPSDRSGKILKKVAEYLNAGVDAVCVVDPESETVQVFRKDQPTSKIAPPALSGDDELTLPGILPGFSAAVSQFFR